MRTTSFKGFTNVTGEAEITEKLAEIAGTQHAAAVNKIRNLMATGSKEQASRVKKQLPALTFSATYSEKRVPERLKQYNDILVLDFDNLSPGQMKHCRELIAADPSTLFVFTSPSGSGLKAGIYLADEEAARWRGQCFKTEKLAFAELEYYHKQMFGKAKAYFERLCGVEVDPSGSDIGRLCFLSYDPQIYINHQALEKVVPPTVIILPPQPVKKNSTRKLMKEEMPGNEAVDCSQIDAALQMHFQQCVNSVRRNFEYKPGQRDTFIYTLASSCYAKQLPEETVARLADRYFGAPDLDVPRIVSNAYRYTSKIDRAEEEKNKTTVQRMIEFLNSQYVVRRNTILERLEIQEKNPAPGSPSPAPFVPMKRKHYNTAYLDMELAGIKSHPALVRSIIDSRFAVDYDPFAQYFGSLPPWDGTIDHIGILADTVETTSPDFWRDCFKRWLVGMVACALNNDTINQLALVLKGEQGKGKSTWIRNLLPPPLKEYYRNGMINPTKGDHMLLLSQRLLINLEEFEGMKKDDIAELKRLITQDSITERKVYDYDPDVYIRRASFIASTNEPRFLEDATGNRRFPTVTVLKIDYKTPVNHDGIYAQAHYLWKHNFHHWYEADEITRLNQQNSQYTLQSAEEELFYVHFRKPLARDIELKWMPVSALLAYLSFMGKIQVNAANNRRLLKVLERDGFRKRQNANHIWEYEVVQLSPEEINTNYKRPNEA